MNQRHYVGGDMIKVIGKQQLLSLQHELAKAIFIANNQRQGETPKFLPYLNVIKKR